MNRLFTYILPYDDGAAPNPFHGMCSLAICKPAIRRVAEPGDWVAGVGSKNAPSGDLSGRLIYAMKVEKKISLRKYDEAMPFEWPHRRPNLMSLHLVDRLGDCIYDFSNVGENELPVQRPGVHNSGDVAKDFGGKNVLISRNFFYFGGNAKRLPSDLAENICPSTQGHRSTANQPYYDQFVAWITGLKIMPGQLYGWPDRIIDWESTQSCSPCSARNEDDSEEEEIC